MPRSRQRSTAFTFREDCTETRNAPAEPGRLRAGAGTWGSYYAHRPAVMGGRIADCLLTLPNPPGPIVVDAKFPL